jgi:hypothetical protein
MYLPPSGITFDDPGFGPGLRGNFAVLDTVAGQLQVLKTAHNAVHGLVASSFDPEHNAGATVYTAVSGHLLWHAMQLQDFQISGITVITGTPQAGTGTQLGIHGPGGALLTDSAGNLCSYGTTSAQTSVGVDGWLQTAFTPPTPPPQLTLPAPINGVGNQNGIGPGSIVYVSLLFPAGLGTYPTFRESSTGSVEAVINLTSQPRYGVALSQTAIVDPIPFASWDNTHSSPVWIGLF